MNISKFDLGLVIILAIGFVPSIGLILLGKMAQGWIIWGLTIGLTALYVYWWNRKAMK